MPSENNIHFYIIVPIYNVAPYLAQCLDSLLAQSFGGFEAILINDGSSDESGAIAARYASADHRFTLIEQENGGLSLARNRGLELVRQRLESAQADSTPPPPTWLIAPISPLWILMIIWNQTRLR